MNNIDNHLEVIYIQEEFINEVDIQGFIKHITKSNIKNITSQAKEIDKLEKGKDIFKIVDKVKSMTKNIPKIKFEKVNNICKSKIPNFKKMKNISATILKNSIPNLNDKSLDIASTYLGIASIVDKKNSKLTQEQNMKENIKKFIFKVRKFESMVDTNQTDNKNPIISKEDIPDYLVAIAIMSGIVGLVSALSMGIYSILIAVSGLFTFGNLIIIIILITILIVAIAATATSE